MKNIIFLNEFHNGDIHMSREYVKDIMNILGTTYNYYYQHNNNSKILKDVKNITSLSKSDYDVKIKQEECLIINTWIASMRELYSGCNFVGYYNLMKKYYSILNISQHLKPIDYYVPSVDFNMFNIQNVTDYFKNNHTRHVLFCNNTTNSGQVANFDMDYVLEKLTSLFPNINFVVTNKIKYINAKNVIYAEDIIKQSDNNDLYEISYLSTFCDTVIGRSSGPYTFSITKDTIRSKKFVCICYNHFDTWYLADSTNIFWSDNMDLNHVINFIKGTLE